MTALAISSTYRRLHRKRHPSREGRHSVARCDARKDAHQTEASGGNADRERNHDPDVSKAAGELVVVESQRQQRWTRSEGGPCLDS